MSRSVSLFALGSALIRAFAFAACDYNNVQENFHIPIYGILCDGVTFEFFSFDGSTKPFTFLRGCFPGDPRPLRRGLRLSDFELTETTTPFIRDLRVVCETIFGIMLLAYISSLTAYRDLSAAKSTKEGKPRKSLDKWDDALQSAKEALQKSCNAYVRRQELGVELTNNMADDAIKALKLRYEYLHLSYCH